MHEPTAGRATLAVLGAGPKGLAIALERAVGHDLAVTGCTPSSTFRSWPASPKGPGSRTCRLGLLADRVLGAYVRPACDAGPLAAAA
jgi:hypothetical protein